jgi:hypothetical protein
MLQYDSAALYIDSAQSKKDKITKIDEIISALTTASLNSAVFADLEEYLVDNGQTKIKSVYRNPDQIITSIRRFMQIKQLLVNDLNGRIVRLVDLHSHLKS